MKVKDLIRARLDYWVARALKMEETHEVEIQVAQRSDDEICVLDKTTRFAPSTDWKDGGQLIERENVCVVKRTGDTEWFAVHPVNAGHGFKSESLLTAAMRALVASVFGDEVEDIK